MQKIALKTAGIIFLVIAILHVVRIFLQLDIFVSETEIPFAVSWIGSVVSAGLGLWMLLASKK